MSNKEFERLKRENDKLKESVRVLSNAQVLKNIEEGIKQIKEGKFLSKKEVFGQS